MVKILDDNLKHYAEVIKKQINVDMLYENGKENIKKTVENIIRLLYIK